MAKKNFMLYGMDWRIFTIFGGAILISAYMNIIPNQLIGGIAVMFTLGIIFGELGEQLPIWNKYCGGGAILAFLACGILTYTNLMPKNIVSISKGWMSTYSFLNVFISTLVVGSLLGLDRKLLIKSGALYLPALLASLAVAALFGILGGLLFGIKPAEVVTAYVLPIMGGGAGAGAIPMAQVYQDVTGKDSSGYLSFAIAILAIGNILAILFAIILDNIGRVFPKLTGHGNLVKVEASKAETTIETKDSKVDITMDDIGSAIFLIGAFFVLAQLTAKKILPSIFGVAIPNFAYLIIFAALANILDLIPERNKKACQKLQQFCGNKLVWIQMAGCGITLINFKQMVSVMSPENLFIAFLIVLGCVIGSGIFGALVGFYPIESSITAGLCMANMGGAGDLASIGLAETMMAANRGENITVIFVNNGIYGMTGGQLAPTTLVGMKASTAPKGRNPKEHGYPMHMCEILNELTAPRYLVRTSCNNPGNVMKTKDAIKKAFQNQLEGKGFSMVEIVTGCPTNWGMTALESLDFIEDHMLKEFPLGVIRDK